MIYIDKKVEQYIGLIVAETARPEHTSHIRPGTPADVVAIREASETRAVSLNRSYVTPEDVKASARQLLRDRVLAQAATRHEDVGPDAMLERILDAVAVP